MSNIGSTALQTSKQEQQRSPSARARGARQRAFDKGTMGMLDDARAMAENAAGQGMQLNPIIYQMLGLSPQMVDRSAELEAAQGEYNAAQSQYDEMRAAHDQIKALPKGKRSKEQRKQLKQLNKQLPKTQKSLESVQQRFNALQTMPNQITGFERMDPNDIDKSSPFSAMNPLNQAQATQAQRLNQYMAGGEVDPTLKQQYTAAEQALRGKLSQRFGPDYESTSVGQTALQNFSREKSEAFATWNEQQVEKYNNLAFQGQANLQTLLANQIGLMREPGGHQMGDAGALSGLAAARLNQANQSLQERSAQQGLSIATSNYNPAGAVAGAASSPAMQKLANAGYEGLKSGAGSLYNWATGAGGGYGGYGGEMGSQLAGQTGASFSGIDAASAGAGAGAAGAGAGAEGAGWLSWLGF